MAEESAAHQRGTAGSDARREGGGDGRRRRDGSGGTGGQQDRDEPGVRAQLAQLGRRALKRPAGPWPVEEGSDSGGDFLDEVHEAGMRTGSFYSRTAPCVPRCVSALDVALEPWTFPAGTSRRSWREHTPERSAGATGVHGCFPETPTPSRPSPVGSIALPSGMAGGAGGQRCSTCPTALLGLSQPWSSTRSFLYMGKGAREARWNSKV